MNTKWLTSVKNSTDISGSIETVSGHSIEWKKADILSADLAEFKKAIADLASYELAPIELAFLQSHPEAASKELFLLSSVPLLENGSENADWIAIEDTIEESIRQFYLADLSKFSPELLKPLMEDVYFFATIKKKHKPHEMDTVHAFLLFAVTPALKYGDIKIINLVVRTQDQGKGLERELLSCIFTLIPNTRRVFFFVRPTNTNALRLYKELGFTKDAQAIADSNHKINPDYMTVLEYKLQKNYPKVSVYIATSIDGYIARKDGSVDWLEIVHGFEDDYGFHKFFASIDVLIMGRNTYESIAYLPQWPYKDKRVIVLSSSLQSVKPEAELYSGDIENLVSQLSEEGVNHIWVDGGKTISQCLNAQIVDEMTLSVIPVLLGSGYPLFTELHKQMPSQLLSADSYPSGLVQIRYNMKP